MAVLRDAEGPLSAADIRSAVTQRTGYAIKHSTVRYVLRHGRWATRGDIKTETAGRYWLDRHVQGNAPGPCSQLSRARTPDRAART